LHKTSGKNVERVGVIKADVEDPSSLSEMASKARVVLNCVGPYRFYGEAVVKACVDNGTSHVDISGEPQVKLLTLHSYSYGFDNMLFLSNYSF
jgi:short subunit dehydrogenase-like uncharacterized protein